MHVAPLVFALLACQPVPSGDGTIPQADRPANFSGAAGAYRLEVRAEPIKVNAEDPITVTVKIISLEPGPWLHPPQRDKLRLWPADIEMNFFVEPLPELDQFQSGENAWEFSWRLMPKDARVKSIPAVEFVYYHTAGARGFKAADGAGTIALEVAPREQLLLTAPPATRAKFQQFAQGPGLLTQSLSGPEWTRTLALGLALPPISCLTGFLLWRRLFPDAAERLRRRRGRALQKALQQLATLSPAATPAQVRGIVADYLRLHFDLPPGGPTPSDVSTALRSRHLPSAVAHQAEDFIHDCDAALFAPATPLRSEHLQAGAKQLLEKLEVQLCASAVR